MPAYRDENGTWYVQFYYKSWEGKRHHKVKRGFKTRKEAVDYEIHYKANQQWKINVSLAEFAEIYYDDKKTELKERTLRNKKYMINTYIVPFFGERQVNRIQSSDIIQWQKIIQEKKLAPTYQRMIANQLSALFNHATIYGLNKNPYKQVKRIGQSDADKKKLRFWTKDEFDSFISEIDEKKDVMYHAIFQTLFWTGMRIGELLALNIGDLDFDRKIIHITKTYYRAEHKDIITEPKTKQSIRDISIPNFLCKELQEYVAKLYKLGDTDRIFPVVQEAVQHKMKRVIGKTKVKMNRLHDLRHSHASFLINEEVEPMLISERLGHKDIRITLNTYGHLYPNRQHEVADLLDRKR